MIVALWTVPFKIELKKSVCVKSEEMGVIVIIKMGDDMIINQFLKEMVHETKVHISLESFLNL